MKHSLIIILFLCFGFTAFGQQPEYPDSGFTNKAEAKNLTINGKKEGKWVAYENFTRPCCGDSAYQGRDSITPLYILTVFKAGEPYGVQKSYYENGKLAHETPFIDGKKNGVEKDYYVSGKLANETHWVNSKKDGIEKDYYENGILEDETIYKNGTLISTKNYDENGNEIKQ